MRKYTNASIARPDIKWSHTLACRQSDGWKDARKVPRDIESIATQRDL